MSICQNHQASMPSASNVSTIVAGFQDMYVTFDKK